MLVRYTRRPRAQRDYFIKGLADLLAVSFYGRGRMVSKSFLNLGSRHAFAWILPQSVLLRLATDLYSLRGLVAISLFQATPHGRPRAKANALAPTFLRTFPLRSGQDEGEHD